MHLDYQAKAEYIYINLDELTKNFVIELTRITPSKLSMSISPDMYASLTAWRIQLGKRYETLQVHLQPRSPDLVRSQL